MKMVLLLGLVTAALSAQPVVRTRTVDQTSWKDGPLDATAVDWSLFPRSYAVVDNERLMYPVDMADWPVKLGGERQLFVDNYLVAAASGVRSTVHQPVKHPANPVMTDEGPIEKNIIVHQVLRDARTGKFRMWYASWIDYLYPGTKIKGRFPTLYAESEDGVRWVRPSLGLLELNGSRANNVVIHGGLTGLFYHPDAADPSRRYLAGVWLEAPYVAREGCYLYASPDGLRWERIREEPLFPYIERRSGFPLPGLGDTTNLRYDPVLKAYVCDAKILFYDPVFRTRGIATSPDLIHWTRPRMTLYPDARDDADAQIYGHISFPYESLWLGMLRVYHMARAGRKQTDIELTVSRDGLNWSRAANREVFIPLGGEQSWERDYTDPAASGPLLVGEELWFYYRGSRHTPEDKQAPWRTGTGLAKLRRDGFVSLDAAGQPGWVETRPLSFTGQTLHLNAAVKPGGYLRVAVTDLQGKQLIESAPVTKDSTDVTLSWPGGAGPAAARGDREHVRLRFELNNAELYAFWFR